MAGERKTVPFNPKKKTQPAATADAGKTVEPAKAERPTVPFRGSREGKPSRVGQFDESEAGKTSAHPRATVPLGVSSDGGAFARELAAVWMRASTDPNHYYGGDYVD